EHVALAQQQVDLTGRGAPVALEQHHSRPGQVPRRERLAVATESLLGVVRLVLLVSSMAASSRSSLGDRADNGRRPASPLWKRGARADAVDGKWVRERTTGRGG